MNKQGAINIIKSVVKQAYAKKQIGVPAPGKKSIVKNLHPIEKVLTTLLTSQFNLFVEDIYWQFPKPACFKVTLRNKQYFFLTEDEDNWILEVESRKFPLATVQGLDRGIAALSRIMRYGVPTDLVGGDMETLKGIPDFSEVASGTSSEPSAQPETSEIPEEAFNTDSGTEETS